MSKTEGTCYTKKELKKGWLMGAVAAGTSARARARPRLGRSLLSSRVGLLGSRTGLLPYGQPRLSTYGSPLFPQQTLMPLVGSGRGYYPGFRARSSAIDLLDGMPHYGVDERSLATMEYLIKDIEDEMYKQEEKANRSCIEGEETALHRYQALNDLLADTVDAYNVATTTPAAAADLRSTIAVIKNRLSRARYGKLSDYGVAPLM